MNITSNESDKRVGIVIVDFLKGGFANYCFRSADSLDEKKNANS
jgi:hypothetical protein